MPVHILCFTIFSLFEFLSRTSFLQRRSFRCTFDKIIPPDTVLYETLTPAREAPLYVMRSFLSEHIFIQGMFFQCLRDFDHIGQISDHDNACKAVV